MGLQAKFNLAVIAVFGLGLAVTWIFLREEFKSTAREDVLQNARIMLSAANAVRTYTAREVEPLIATADSNSFQRATVPAYAAQTNFRAVQTEYRDYSYKEAALNPTNPADRATEWEADFINAFRNDVALGELIGERETPNGRVLTLGRPITINQGGCLNCHSTAERAPAALVRTYGTANGFGWQLGETIGAQLVSVPMALALSHAESNLRAAMAVLGGVFLAILVVLNLLLHFLVIRPVLRISRTATAVSLGKQDVEEFELRGRDEVAQLSAAFNRMRRSLDSAMSMLGG